MGSHRVNRFMVLVWLATSALAAGGVCPAFSPPGYCQDRIAAIVNNEAITQKDLETFANFMRIQLSNQYSGEALERKIKGMQKDLLERLIEDKLILQEARRNKVSVDENRIKGKIAELKRAYGSDREFQDSLAAQGMTQEDVETRMRDQMMIYSIVESKIKSKIVVKPTEITDFYNKNVSSFVSPERRDFISLMVSEESLAQDISVQLSEGKDLEEIAQTYSIKVNSFFASKGGELKKEIEDVVFGLQQDQTSQQVTIGTSHYFFKVKNIVASRQQGLGEVQAEINRLLQEQKLQEGVMNWVEGLKKRAYIKTF